jgi:hypothetical protein
MNKIVLSNEEVKRAIKASGRRVMTGHRRRKLVAQLKAQKLAEAMVPPPNNSN